MSFSTINSFNSIFFKNSQTYYPPPSNLAFDTSNQLFTFTKPKTNTNMQVAYYNVFLNGGFDLSFSYALIGNVVPTLTNTYGNMYSDNILLNGIYNVSSSTTSINGNGNIYQSFNSSGSNYWYVSNTGLTNTIVNGTGVSGEWLQIKCPNKLKMSSFTLSTPILNNPSLLMVAGSTDGITWNNTIPPSYYNTLFTTTNSTTSVKGGYMYISFNGTGTIMSPVNISCSILMVGGGGSGQDGDLGGAGGGAGGGGGGIGIGTFTLIANTLYHVVVGIGGIRTNTSTGTNGGSTYIQEVSNNYFVYGGGGGSGLSGGSGGGFSGQTEGNGAFQTTIGGAPLRISYVNMVYNGNYGGAAYNRGYRQCYGGGGGGAGAIGGNATPTTGGVGGIGYRWINGSYYGGGGGAGGTGSAGGLGGGGSGASTVIDVVSSSGTANTGGGGGGGTSGPVNSTGANGGSGIVILALNTSFILSLTTVLNTYSIPNYTANNAYQYYRFICTAPLTGNVALSQINFSGVPDSFSLPNVNGNTYTVNANYGPNRESSKSNSVTAVLTVPTISSISSSILTGNIVFTINSALPTGSSSYTYNNININPTPSTIPIFSYSGSAITLTGGFLGDTSYNFSLNASYGFGGNSAFSPIITSRYTLTVPTISSITNYRINGNIVFTINSTPPSGASDYIYNNLNISPAPSRTPLFSYSVNAIVLSGGFTVDTSYNFSLNALYNLFGASSGYSNVSTLLYKSGIIITDASSASATLVRYYPFSKDILDYSNRAGLSNLQTITPAGAATTTLFTNVQSSVYKSDGNAGSLYNSDVSYNVSGTNLAPYLLTVLPNNQNGYTFCFWLNYTGSTYSRGGNIFQLNFTNNYPNNMTSYNMSVQYGANGYFQCVNSTGYNNIPSLSSNTFYHFGITLSKSNIMKFYLNGVLQSTGGVGTNLPFTYNSNLSGIQFFTGVSQYGNEKLQGYIQNFYYFDGVLSDADITTIYNLQYT